MAHVDMRLLWLGFKHLFAGARCEICDCTLVRGEDLVCTSCEYRLLGSQVYPFSPDSPLIERISADIHVGNIGALLTYRRGNEAAELIKHGKYDDRPELIDYLARRLASSLVRSNALAGIDAIQPVPMNIFKRLDRGYNQADIIARHISRATGLPIVNAIAARRHPAQARNEGVVARAKNVSGIYYPLSGHRAEGRHILLVDDIITSGATASEAMRATMQAGATRVSLVTLAATMND